MRGLLLQGRTLNIIFRHGHTCVRFKAPVCGVHLSMYVRVPVCVRVCTYSRVYEEACAPINIRALDKRQKRASASPRDSVFRMESTCGNNHNTPSNKGNDDHMRFSAYEGCRNTCGVHLRYISAMDNIVGLCVCVIVCLHARVCAHLLNFLHGRP